MTGARVGEASDPGPTSSTSWDAYSGWHGPQSTPGIPQAELAQQSTSKVPPFWSPELELKGYPFRVWKQDIEVCKAIIQRLGGAARVLARTIPRDMSTRGSLDAQGNPQVS
eukprot:2646782-Karenia_brevis.AAC.1